MARIQFSNWERVVQPGWAGDFFNREHLLPGGGRVDPAQFRRYDAVVVTVSANAVATDTSIDVDALSGPIPSGTILDFSDAGKFALLTADADAGDISITVEALPENIDDGDTATYPGTELKTIVSGTLVGRTFAERASGTAFGPAADADDEVFIVAFDVTDADTNADVELVRYGTLIKENLLPGFASLSATLLGKLRANYQTTRGATV